MLSEIAASITENGGMTMAPWAGLKLTSAFQPVYSLAHKRVVGHEALVRALDPSDALVSPAELFNANPDIGRLTRLDRTCRYVHGLNFKRFDNDVGWLFLNIHPAVVKAGHQFGPFFAQMLAACNLAAVRVVIEIVEHPIRDQGLLRDTVAFYRSLGCLIALDDFGAGASNFQRVWTLSPDIIKLDRSMVVQADEQKRVRQMIPRIVGLLHQAGSLVLIEGIETEEQAMIAMESDADMVQGFYFGRPAPAAAVSGAPDFGLLFEKHKALTLQSGWNFKQGYRDYRRRFRIAADLMAGGNPLNGACRELLADPAVKRCFLLRPSGVQIGRTLVAPGAEIHSDPRYAPLEDARNADWFRRPYLQRAIFNPGEVQISRPYLSITGAHMCVTLSICFSNRLGAQAVLCCDLDFDRFCQRPADASAGPIIEATAASG